MKEEGHLDPADVVSIISNLTVDDDAFIVGGQATNLWAWYYRDDAPYLKDEGPFTSVDIDYFGHADVAQKLADALGGRVFRPGPDSMNTPNTAVIEANLNGKSVRIDFLNNVLGVEKKELGNGISSLGVIAEVNGETKPVAVLLMHPISCLKSRIANVMHAATQRRDPTATRQTHAAYHVTRAHIEHALRDGDHQEAKECFQGIFEYLRRDKLGRRAHLEVPVDPLGILRAFADDPRIDKRYRQKNLGVQITEIERFRTGLEERIAPSREPAHEKKGSRGQTILNELKAKHGSVSAAMTKTTANTASESVILDATQKPKGTGIVD